MLTLCVVEVGRNGDDRLRNGFAHTLFSIGLDLLEHHSRDLFRHVIAFVDRNDSTTAVTVLYVIGDGLLLLARFAIGTADEALHGSNGVLGVGDRFVLCSFADRTFTVFAKTYYRRGSAIAFSVNQNFWL